MLIGRVLKNRPQLGFSLQALYHLTGAALMVILYAFSERFFTKAWRRDTYEGIEGDFTLPTWPLKLLILVGAVVCAIQFARHVGIDFRTIRNLVREKRLDHGALVIPVVGTIVVGLAFYSLDNIFGFSAVEEGIAQVGLILKNFEPSKLALELFNYVTPFVGHDSVQMITIDRNMRKRVPELNKLYAEYDQVFLQSGSSPSMQLFTKFPVRKFEDLKGHKIGASGSMGLWLCNTGAVWVSSSMLNSFTDIKNGLYDGYPISEVLAFPYKTYEVAKYLTRTGFGVSATSAITVNTDTWNDMPKHARDIFRDVAQNYGAWQSGIDRGKINKFVGIMKKKGVKVFDMPVAERKRWAMRLPNLAKEWADRLEKRGLPGRKVVKAFMDEARAMKVSIARHWDRE